MSNQQETKSRQTRAETKAGADESQGRAAAEQAEFLDRAAETYFLAMKTGLKLQEEFVARWLKTAKDAATSEDWPARAQEMAYTQARDNADEVLKLMERSTRESIDLLGKAFDLGRSVSAGDAQGKLQQLWESSFSVLNNSTRSMVQTNTKLMQSWAELMKQGMQNVAGQTERAAAAAGETLRSASRAA